jgi:hypothetical protein
MECDGDFDAGSANRHVTDPGRFLALGETIVRTHLNLLPSPSSQHCQHC